MDTVESVRSLLKSALQLGSRADRLTADSALLGAIPEFDSMAVVSIIAMMEEQYGISVSDDEISADTFSTVGSLARFLAEKMAQ